MRTSELKRTGRGRRRGFIEAGSCATDDSPVKPESDRQDEDAPLARDEPDWFARELGAEWAAEEPGIYRHVGPDRPFAEDPAGEGGNARSSYT